MFTNLPINWDAKADFASLNSKMTFEEVIDRLGKNYIDVGSGVPLIVYDYTGGYNIWVQIYIDFLKTKEWKIESITLTRNGVVSKRLFFRTPFFDP